MKIFTCMALLMIFLSLFSCKEKVTDPKEQAAFSFNSGKCHDNLQKQGALPDSSFEYTFNDNLLLDFTVPGNCCPDSDRFIVLQNISSDTIYISAEDTAEHLCRCTCNYHIYARFSDLPKDHYIIFCTLKGMDNPIYIVDVFRSDLILFNSPLRKRGYS